MKGCKGLIMKDNGKEICVSPSAYIGDGNESRGEGEINSKRLNKEDANSKLENRCETKNILYASHK